MKFRVLYFFIFQFVIWWLYFHWDSTSDTSSISQRSFEVNEVINTVSSSIGQEPFQLILRSDGFFTKINMDKTMESGLWDVNYDIPSIILKSPSAEYRYRILSDTEKSLEIELINAHEIIQVRENKNKDGDDKLFSSFSRN